MESINEDWDVIVVGAGTAGIPTAIFAGQRGARVLLVEADSRIGGTLHWSTGQMTAAGTKLQKRLGIEDHPDWHFDDCMRISRGIYIQLLVVWQLIMLRIVLIG